MENYYAILEVDLFSSSDAIKGAFRRLAAGKNLSFRQTEAIDNIIISFQIDLDLWENDEKRNAALDLYLSRFDME